MAATASFRSPDLSGFIGCKAEFSNNILSHLDDESPARKPPLDPSPTSARVWTTPRRKSALKIKPSQSQRTMKQDIEGPKKVHFDCRSQQMCFFSPVDAPASLESKLRSDVSIAANAGFASFRNFQLSWEYPYCTLNSILSPPSSWQPIQIQNLQLLSTGCKIRGTIAVLNLAFQKCVSVRFTFDDWKTVSDVAARYYQSLYLKDQIVSDIFGFIIDEESLPLETDGRLQICASYRVLEEEFWDNNAGGNYVIFLNS